MKVEFYPSSPEVEAIVPAPKPAAHYIPQWYKDIPKFAKSDIQIDDNGRLKGVGLKSCVPFLDAMINGYIQETWQDIAVDFRDGGLKVSCPTDLKLFDSRQTLSTPLHESFYQTEFVWKAPWMPRLPKGWSMLFVQPLNHTELPFETATGIQDADNFYHSPFGNFPFYIRYGFKGIIPAGTPMYQMIPIKRESWESKTMKFDFREQYKRSNMIAKKFHGAYATMFHVKKEFK